MIEEPMIVRVARAIAISAGEEDWRDHIAAARAAVKAMREPTCAMLEAAVPDFPDWGFLPDEWRAMIDYAATEQLN
jgi:hypothetical protein